MSLTSGSVSHLVRELEETVGVRLLERTTRSLRLSKAGEAWLPHAERILGAVSEASQCALDLREGRLGGVRIAVTQLLASVKLPGLVSAYREIAPDTRITIVEANPDAMPDLVSRGDVDLALGPERPAGDEVASEDVFADDLMLMCDARHRFGRRRSVAWRELAGERVNIEAGAALRTMIDIDHALHLEPTMPTLSVTTGMALVAAGQGVMLSTSYVRPLLVLHDLRLVPLVEPKVRRRIKLYRHARRGLSPAAQRFGTYVKDALGGAPRAGRVRR